MQVIRNLNRRTPFICTEHIHLQEESIPEEARQENCHLLHELLTNRTTFTQEHCTPAGTQIVKRKDIIDHFFYFKVSQLKLLTLILSIQY